MSVSLWQQCLSYLQNELPASEFSTWIRPLQAELITNILLIYAPNKFVLDWVRDKYSSKIYSFLHDCYDINIPLLRFKIGSKSLQFAKMETNVYHAKHSSIISSMRRCSRFYTLNNSLQESELFYQSNINPKHNFDNFIEGKCNKLARSAAQQVANCFRDSCNPLFVYGGTGLGKTHLLHAIGNYIMLRKTNTKVVYTQSENFVQDMVKALRSNTIEEFKVYYRSLDVLLIDDIQFFSYKERSQEEFFYTLNALLEGNQQIILTSDRYPKEIYGVTDRLRSRFERGLTVAIEPPGLDMSIKILMKKAKENNVLFSEEVALFLAKRLRSNVRELEGAFNCIIANSTCTGESITIDFVRESLRDLFAFQEQMFSIHNIQKVVAKYYRIKVKDLLSKSRFRLFTRPRQMAMALSKEFSSNSLSEIGYAFGNRDHTTVLYAYKKIKQLCDINHDIKADFLHLTRKISSF